MQTTQVDALGEDKARSQIVLQRVGVVGFWFFFAKGCLWIAALGVTYIFTGS